jgi:hypothetical protein
VKSFKEAAYLFGTVLKCFFILVILGIVLPSAIDLLLFYFYKGSGNIYNSIFVNKNYSRRNFIDIFMHIFKQYIMY